MMTQNKYRASLKTPIPLSLNCTGTETSLLSCLYTSPLGYPSSNDRGVRVTCSSPEEDEGEYVLLMWWKLMATALNVSSDVEHVT